LIRMIIFAQILAAYYSIEAGLNAQCGAAPPQCTRREADARLRA